MTTHPLIDPEHAPAAEFFSMAAERGNVQALVGLGNIYIARCEQLNAKLDVPEGTEMSLSQLALSEPVGQRQDTPSENSTLYAHTHTHTTLPAL